MPHHGHSQASDHGVPSRNQTLHGLPHRAFMSVTTAVTSPEQFTQVPQGRQASAEFGRYVAHISRESSVFFAGTVFTAAVSYVFRVYLARKLGAEALGIYALGMTMVNFLAIFNCIGLPQAAVRFTAAYSAIGHWKELGKFLSGGSTLLLLLNLPIVALMVTAGRWFAVRFYHAPALASYLWLFALIMVVGNFTTFFGQILNGYKDVSRRTVITNFVGSPVTMALTVGLLVMGMGLTGYMWAQIGGTVIVLLLLTGAVWRHTPQAARQAMSLSPDLNREVISFSAASFGVAILELMMSQTDKIMIGFYLNAREVGIYAMASALVGFIPIALQSVNQIFTPVIADLHARCDRLMLGRLFQTLTKWTVGLTAPLAIVVSIFARPLMGTFGRDFESGWVVLVIGTAGQLINCAAGATGYLLLMSGNERKLVRVQSVVAAITVAMSVALIPRWGVTGAAIASALTPVVCNLLCLREVNRALGLQPYNRGYLRLGAPLAVAVGISMFLKAALLPAYSAVLAISGTMVVAYLGFIATSLLAGLDADDQLVVEVLRLRLRTRKQRSESCEGMPGTRPEKGACLP
jgi:O-antigen/teichoic acid export membrane protein